MFPVDRASGLVGPSAARIQRTSNDSFEALEISHGLMEVSVCIPAVLAFLKK
jgi:hypothetical protein